MPTKYLINDSISISACSRDSRPRDWSRLGSIFLVSVSAIISQDSRDSGQLYFLVLDLCSVLLWLISSYARLIEPHF